MALLNECLVVVAGGHGWRWLVVVVLVTRQVVVVLLVKQQGKILAMHVQVLQ